MTSEQIEMMVGDGRTAVDFEGVTIQRVGGRQPWRVSKRGTHEHFLTRIAACVRVADLLAGAA